jgi:CheY-like chemotaxis protein
MHGYKVLEARSGGEAILVSQRTPGPIHMLLTDVVMANMSGRELADHLRPLRPEMRILFISGYSEDAILSEGGGIRGLSPGNPAAGREDAAFLGKPFTPKTLALKVRDILEMKAGVRQDQVHPV